MTEYKNTIYSNLKDPVERDYPQFRENHNEAQYTSGRGCAMSYVGTMRRGNTWGDNWVLGRVRSWAGCIREGMGEPLAGSLQWNWEVRTPNSILLLKNSFGHKGRHHIMRSNLGWLKQFRKSAEFILLPLPPWSANLKSQAAGVPSGRGL